MKIIQKSIKSIINVFDKLEGITERSSWKYSAQFVLSPAIFSPAVVGLGKIHWF